METEGDMGNEGKGYFRREESWTWLSVGGRLDKGAEQFQSRVFKKVWEGRVWNRCGMLRDLPYILGKDSLKLNSVPSCKYFPNSVPCRKLKGNMPIYTSAQWRNEGFSYLLVTAYAFCHKRRVWSTYWDLQWWKKELLSFGGGTTMTMMKLFTIE